MGIDNSLKGLIYDSYNRRSRSVGQGAYKQP